MKENNIFSKIGIVLKVKLKQNGAIEEAKVNKIYPNRIDIEITERSKRFQIQTESGKYIGIDEQGYVLGIDSEKAEVPLIIGMSIKEEEVDKTKRLEQKYIDKMEQEVYKMEKDSIVLINQITTISKQRIFKDTVRRNVKISNNSLDLIDKQIIKFFTH